MMQDDLSASGSNPEKTLEYFYKAYPKELVDHFKDCIASPNRVVAKLDKFVQNAKKQQATLKNHF